MPGHGRVATVLGARSNHSSDGPFAVTNSVKISGRSAPPPVMVVVAVAGTTDAVALKSIVGSEPPSGTFRLRKMNALSGGVPALVMRVATKSAGPSGTSANVTGFVEVLPMNSFVSAPNDR